MAPKKKLTKKEKQRLEAERAEAARIVQEKELQRKLEEDRELKRLERVAAERRQKQEVEENKIRRVHLKESCDYFQSLKNVVDEIYHKTWMKREWKVYMRCNGLPNTYDPSDVRNYIQKWILDSQRGNDADRNWLLTTNEMSILTQDYRVINMTRSHLKEQQHNMGDFYAKRVVEVLGILKELGESILDTKHLSRSIRIDLNHLKYELQKNLSQHLDEYTYKILSNIDRDMDLDGLSLAWHKYESSVFKTQLWTIREAPLPPLNPKEQEKADRSHTEITFPLLEMDITLPTSVKMMNTAVRVLWLSYDHFSDYCPSYSLPCDDENQIDLDISQAARREWKKRKEILKSTLQTKEGANRKGSKEPEGIVDAGELYETYERDQAKLALERIGPEALRLNIFETNMRRYRIVAGIYYVEHLEQPHQDTQLEKKKFLRTLTQPNQLRRLPFHQTYIPPPPVLPGVRRLPEEIEAELREVEANLDRLGSVNIKLPEDIIWFEPPVVCRWESLAESKMAETPRQVTPEKSTNSHPEETTDAERVVIEDFNLLDVPRGLDLYSLLRDFVIPRMPDGYIVKIGGTIVEPLKSSEPVAELELLETIEPCIKDAMTPTNSPRPLFPFVEINQELVIKERQCNLLKEPQPENEQRKVYMFSRLLRDLDEMCEEQIPFVNEMFEEINENFEEEEEAQDEEEIEPDQEYMGLSFMRSNDYSWSLGRKEDVEETPQPTEQSDSESETDEAEEIELKPNPNESLKVGKWTNRDVHDVKFNEEKLSIQFKFGRMGAFGLAINWYNNLPFQAWELKPDVKNPEFVVFNLTGAVISIEVLVVSEGFILNSYQGGMSNIVQEIIGLTLSFKQLKDTLFRAAINLFPEEDAFCYTEGTCEKNAVLESHLYMCMADLALTHNFAWSRWNMLAGRRSCVLLMREIFENRKLPPHNTLLVTSQKATLVNCTDMSPSFSTTPTDGMHFHADLYHLAREISTPLSLEKHSLMDPLLRQNVSVLLKATSPLSFS